MSEIRATTISDAAGTGPISLTGQSAAKAWVNYQMIINTVGDSFNVSSVTDNGTGNFTTLFATQMANAYFLAASSNAHTRSGSSQNYSSGAHSGATSGIGYARESSGGAAHDQNSYENGLSVFGDLA
jgi:hypothetical protein